MTVEAIRYPNAVADLVVVQYRGGGRFGFMVRPVTGGLYRLCVWPDGVADADLAATALLDFPSDESPPQSVVIDLRQYDGLFRGRWIWALVRTDPFATATEDFARALIGPDVVGRERFAVPVTPGRSATRFVAWSCHQPFEGDKGRRARLHPDAMDVLEWYAGETETFAPHLVWGQGDTAYSDGCDATDFSDQVYGKSRWNVGDAPARLQREYRSMYRHFWSLAPMRRTMSRLPHLFIWDDHEIHDGWGSEQKDLEPGNQEMFRIAHGVAGEYILNAGPRLRPAGVEAHQAYTLGPMAAFIFDTRTTRNYVAQRDRLISRQQFDDFVGFLDVIARRPDLTDLVTCTTVPFVGLRTWVEVLMTRAPDIVNGIASGIRDDVRDGWTSPGNLETLSAVLDALKRFMLRRPEVRITNISGDIHVANAYEIIMASAPQPIYQVTTSAITNRQHPPGIIAVMTEIDDVEDVGGVGLVRRVWDTVDAPNVLQASFADGHSTFNLRVWNPEDQGAADLLIER
jgi:hypothetical protein